MAILKLSDILLTNKKVLIRVDMNVPIKDGFICDDNRIKSSLPTIKYCLKHGASVILMTHLGRPLEGFYNKEYDVLPIAQHLSKILGQEVRLINNFIDDNISLKIGEVVLLQNVRFNIGEKDNSDILGKRYAYICDVYVNDAFGVVHRAQASTFAVAKYAKEKCIGLLLDFELRSLNKALIDFKKPMVAIVGGSKVSSKLKILKNLSLKVDKLILGGGIANTFLVARGYNVGKSLVELSLLDEAKEIINMIESNLGGSIPLPIDVRVSKKFNENSLAVVKKIEDIEDDDIILDVGIETENNIREMILNSRTILWNGPLGVFEFKNFALGTYAVAKAISDSKGFSIAGGGDTVAAISKFGINEKIDYISTGGGSFLKFLEGGKFPALDILDN